MSMVLYGPDGNVLPPEAFHSPIDFGPGRGLTPRISQVDYPPREYQYVPGFNLIASPRTEQQGKRFSDLRVYAQLCSYARLAINYRKQQITGLKWSIVPRQDQKSPAAKKKYAKEITEIESFFRDPNRLDGVSWHQWIKQALEEMLVTDALVFYVHPRKDGRVHSYVQLDGGTIKPLIDQLGHVAGYQQILYGYPSSYYPAYTTDSDEDDPEAGRLRYVVSNPRVDSVYGTSPLEEIAPILDTAIRRQLTQLAWYTDGNIPTMMVEAPEEVKTADQIASVQALYDRMLSGDETRRHRMLVVPHGTKGTQFKPFTFTKDENDALVSSVCAHFGVPKHLFISETNRSTAAQTSDDMADIGFRPIRTFLSDLFSRWIGKDFNQPDLEWHWDVEESGKGLEVAQSFKLYIDAGVMTPDEVRQERGLDPLPEDQREKAFPKPAPPMPFGQVPGEKPQPGQSQQKPGESKPKQPKPEEAEKALGADEVADLARYRRFALRKFDKGQHTTPFTSDVIASERHAFLERELPLAKSKDDIVDIFAKAERMTTGKRIKHVADALRGYFAAQKKDVLEIARQRLPNETKGEES